MNVFGIIETAAVELLAFGFWLLAFGFWLLAFGFWLWLLAFRSGAHSFAMAAHSHLSALTAGHFLTGCMDRTHGGHVYGDMVDTFR